MSSSRRDNAPTTDTAEGVVSRIKQRLRQAWSRSDEPDEQAGLGGILDLLPDPTVIVDAQDCIQAANQAARDRFDVALDGSLAETLLAPDHRESYLAHLGRATEAGGAEDRVAVQADGTETPVTLTIRPVAGAEPALFAVGLGTPVSHEPDAAAEAEARRRTLNAVLDALPDPIVAVSRTGRVLFRNRASASAISQGDGAGADTLPAAQWQAADAAMRSGVPVVSEETIGHETRSTTRIPVRAGTGEVVGLVAVSRDVTSQRADRARLDDARRTAEDSARAGGEVLATTSHEIRTLMSGVTGMTTLLLGTDLDGDQRDFVETIRASSATLLRVVNDVLDLSKMDVGMLEIERQPFDIRQTLQAALAVVAQQAHAKRLVLSGAVDSAIPASVTGDATRIQQVLANLLTNAVKFTEEGSVQVNVEQSGPSALAFSVHDTGVGIPPERLAAVFEPFAQADASTARTHGGTGLGLSICRRLVALMGGELTAESAPTGSVFRFTVALGEAEPTILDEWIPTAPEVDTLAPQAETPTLPASAEPPEPAAPPVAPPTAAEEDLQPPPVEYPPEASAPTGPKRSKVMDMDSMLPSASVLLVEDDPVMQKVTRMTLQRLGYRPTVVDNGRKGVIAARARRYDVILMDIMMPVMDGLEATRQIRADPGPHAPPVIVMLTANAMKGDRDRGVAAGCDAYLTKPVAPQELASTIERAIRDQAVPA